MTDNGLYVSYAPDGSGRRTLLADALGSILALSDDAGTTQTSYTYEPFGATTQTGQANSNSFQYTGRENDQTGLQYYRARYYAPRTQRFLSEDPIGFGGGNPNLYGYVFNSPMNRSDPTGLAGANCAFTSGALGGRKNNGSGEFSAALSIVGEPLPLPEIPLCQINCAKEAATVALGEGALIYSVDFAACVACGAGLILVVKGFPLSKWALAAIAAACLLCSKTGLDIGELLEKISKYYERCAVERCGRRPTPLPG